MDAVVPWMWYDFVWCGAQESLEMLGASSSAQRVHGKAFPTNPRWWHLPRRCNDSLGHLHVVTQPAPDMTELRETTRWSILGFLPDCLECCCRAFADVDSWLWAGRTEIQNLWAFWGRELQCWQNNCKWKMSADYGWLVLQELPFGEIGRGGTTGRMYPSICFCGAFGSWDVVVGCRGLLTLGKRHLIALHCWFRVPAGLLVFVKIALVAPKLAIGCILLTFGSGIFTTPRWDIDQTLGKLHFGQLSRQKGLEMLEPFGWAELVGSIKIITVNQNQSLNVPAKYSQTAISSVETWAWECESNDEGTDSNLSGSCKLNAVVTVRRASDAFWNGR